MRLKRILEIGGGDGYSARNFCAAIPSGGNVYTISTGGSPEVAPWHFVVDKDCRNIAAEDIDNEPVDLIFFDCHDESAQMAVYDRLFELSLITERTILAFHDTNLHYARFADWSAQIRGGWIHQQAERRMVNELHKRGWDAVVFDTMPRDHGPKLPYRHGVTLMRRFKPFEEW